MTKNSDLSMPSKHTTAGIAGTLQMNSTVSPHSQYILASTLEHSIHASLENAFCVAAGGEILVNDGLILAIAGRVRYRNATSLSATLQALAMDYRQMGKLTLANLTGVFVLAILDPTQNYALLAIDKIGIEQVYYRSDNTGFSFCSRLAPLVQLSPKNRQLDQQALYNYIYCHFVPSPRSIYCGIHKLPAGHVVEWQKGEMQISPYWLPKFSETPIDLAASGKEMLAIIRSAVETAVAEPTDQAVAAFLSGGLDSSTVAGMLAQSVEVAQTYSIGFDVPGYDEMAYARIARQHFHAKGYEHYVTPADITQWLPLVAMGADEPFGNSSLLPAFLCAQCAREQGFQVLLAGDGGDELFAGNERYAKQGIFEYFNQWPLWLQSLLFISTKPLAKMPVLRKAYSYVSQARTPLPDRMDTYVFLERHNPQTVFEDGFIESIDIHEPRTLKRRLFAALDNASKLNRMMYLDWHFTLHDNDLVKVNTACRLAGIEVIYPMLTDELVLLSTRIPSKDKLRGSNLRWFYKQASQGFLPRSILEKKKHGFGLPFGIWMQNHQPLQDLALDSLSRIKTRGFIRPQFIDELLRLHRDKHAAYYGELVWVLMMLDLWLEGQEKV